MSKTDTFNQKEIAVAINNAIAFAKSPKKLGTITEKRLARLYEYATLLFKPLSDELVAPEELPFQDNPELHLTLAEIIKPEEAVLICLCGAMYFHALKVMGTTKLPAMDSVGSLLEKK